MPENQDWAVRPCTPDDENVVVYLWLKSYSRSDYGNSVQARADAQKPNDERYWTKHRNVVEFLVRKADVNVLVDSKAPHIVWGFACTEGTNVIHYVALKRDFYNAGAGPDMMRSLLGDRFDQPCVLSHELTEFRHPELKKGIKVPDSWKVDPWFVAHKLTREHRC